MHAYPELVIEVSPELWAEKVFWVDANIGIERAAVDQLLRQTFPRPILDRHA